MHDMYNNLLPARAISPIASSGGNAILTTQTLDTQGYQTAMLYILIGNLADAGATFTVEIQESATDFSGAAIDDAKLNVDEANVSFDEADDDSVRRIEVHDMLRYLQATITPAGNADVAFFCAMWLLGNPRHRPVTAQAT